MSKIIAVLISDIHLSAKAPRCRVEEPDWWEVQARQLREVRDIAKKNRCMVLCAGDIFDKWNSPPELIRFALEELPDGMICVPGNHDLPYHDQNELNRSAYAVLEAAGKIENISIDCYDRGFVASGCRLRVFGFGWNTELVPCPISRKGILKKDGPLRVALIHKYVWHGVAGHPGASFEEDYQAHQKLFTSYDVVHLGDNHKFWAKGNTINPGSFYRRTIEDGSPFIGLLRADGTVTAHEMESAKADIVTMPKSEPSDTANVTLEEFIEQLKSAPESTLNYHVALSRYIRDNGVSEDVASLIYKALEVE